MEKSKVLKCFIKVGKSKLGAPAWFIRTMGNADIVTVYSCLRHAKVIRDAINKHEIEQAAQKQKAEMEK